MRLFCIAASLFFSLILLAQNEKSGSYKDHFGSELILNKDFSFDYKWHFDLVHSWTNGTWNIINDTIYLTAIPIFDTLRYIDSANKILSDSLILSIDKKAESVLVPSNKKQKGIPIAMVAFTGGQNSHPFPQKLFYERGRLFEINNEGKLITQKMPAILTNNFFDPWYFKVK